MKRKFHCGGCNKMEINSLYQAKESLKAFLNYNKCDKHCELPNSSCCCYRTCMSKNQGDFAYSMENVNDGIEYILNYFNKIGQEMSR